MSEPKPVTLGGVTYPSVSAAARALGVSKQAVSQKIARGPHGSSGARRGHETTLDGMTYPSRAAAARAARLAPQKPPAPKPIGELVSPRARAALTALGVAALMPDEARQMITVMALIHVAGCGWKTVRAIERAAGGSLRWSEKAATREEAMAATRIARDVPWALKALAAGWTPPAGWQWPEGKKAIVISGRAMLVPETGTP